MIKLPEEITNPIIKSLSAEHREMIGSLIVFLLLMGGLVYIVTLRDSMKPKCWELHEFQGKYFKLDACNGNIIEWDIDKIKKAD